VIDFRYHLVSIIAVFLALAVGLLVGVTALPGESIKVLQRAQRVAEADNKTLSAANKQLSQQVAADQALAQAGSQRLLGGLLPGRKVVLIVAPNASSSQVNGIITAVGQAGGTVTGQIDLTQQFVQTAGPQEASLTQLAQTLAPRAGVTLPAQVPSQEVAGQQDAAQVIAASVLTKDAAAGGLSTATAGAILTGFTQGGYLNVKTTSGAATPATATLAVVITASGAPPLPGFESQALVAVTQEINAAASATVMAGPVSAIGSTSPIQLESSAANPVSTVDNADTASGQIMVVQALRLSLDGKSAQSYGIESGDAPSPAPTPAPSPSTSGLAGAGG
jgi:hypothetical protein